MKKVFIAADHAGFELKAKLISSIPEFDWKDLGPHNNQSVDYPDFADALCMALKNFSFQNSELETFGVLICGSGQGMAIRANKYPHIRAALCYSKGITELSRQHNHANVLCMGSRFTTPEDATAFLRIFAETKFEGGRHQNRLDKINKPFSC